MDHIFGGFASNTWDRSSGYKNDPNAFIFSVSNPDNKQAVFTVKRLSGNNAIYCWSTNGPTFGAGHDIYVADNSDLETTSYSNLGQSYLLNGMDIRLGKHFLVGSRYFLVNEIEVFKQETICK